MDDPLRKKTSKIPEHLFIGCTPREKYLIESAYEHSEQNGAILDELKKGNERMAGFDKAIKAIDERHEVEDLKKLEEDIATKIYRKSLHKSVKKWSLTCAVVTGGVIKALEFLK